MLRPLSPIELGARILANCASIMTHGNVRLSRVGVNPIDIFPVCEADTLPLDMLVRRQVPYLNQFPDDACVI